jgi:phosphate/sulfate permease
LHESHTVSHCISPVQAISVLGCSILGLPVSTSHCLVGSVIGVGLAQKALGVKGALQLHTLKKIIFGWLGTIPLAMLVAICVFYPFQHLFQT